MNRIKTVFFLGIACFLSSNCTVYKSEGKKSFESATTEYGSRATKDTSEELKNCELVSSDIAESLLEQYENDGHISNIIFSQKNQNYYSCSEQY
ncbi:MAG: hypothetical protein ACK5P5_02250 [Pseudobdellovibrionaceae bacterium]|jgi:hypothetical protein